MNTPNNLEWVDELLSGHEVINTSHLYHHEHDKEALKQTIATKLAEAYKQGGIDELKHLWSDDVIYWSPNGTSSEFDKSITLQERIATLTNDKEQE